VATAARKPVLKRCSAVPDLTISAYGSMCRIRLDAAGPASPKWVST
jgi:hypothetical protein